MFHSTRLRLATAAICTAAALPLVLQVGTAGEETATMSLPDSPAAGQYSKDLPSPCSCGGGDTQKSGAGSLEIVKFLDARWSADSLRAGHDFALVYADVPGLAPDYYLLRVYAAGEQALATLVDWHGIETPFDAEFAVVGKRSVRLYVDVLGLGAATDGDPPSAGSDPPPSELELDLTCGDDNWIFVWWINDDGSIGWDAECL